jgi:hypothetical protein
LRRFHFLDRAAAREAAVWLMAQGKTARFFVGKKGHDILVTAIRAPDHQ